MSREREGGSKDGGKRNGRYDRRRISENRELEEPEWFSGGPISQTDTIELRGFDESEKPNGKKKLSPSRVKRAKEWSKKKTDTTQAAAGPGEKEAEQAGGGAGGGAGDPTGRSTPGPQGAEQPSQEPQQQQTKSGETTEGGKSASMSDQSFNLDDILKCDSIPGLLPNGVGGDGDNMKSRFSRWFKVQESPERQPQQAESRRSSMHDDHHIIKDLLSDIGETSVSIPGDSEAYFAPISPAGGGGGGGVIGGKRAAQAAQPLNIMEMLQKGKQAPQMAGKILSLDELEAKMRRNTEASVGLQAQKHQKQKPDEEMTAAFKKLLAQAQAAGPAVANGPMNKTQPMSLLEMLSHSQQQDEAARLSGSAHMLGVNAGVAGLHQQHHHQQQHHLPNELSLKLQQAQFQQQQKQQMEMLNKLINATVHPQQMRTSPLHDIGMQQSRELLSRPEAQAILQGLKRGEITTQHLYQQLANPALQPRHREMLVTILKMQGGGGGSAAGYGPSPRVLSPVPPHHMFQQQQQQLRVSPLPPNAMHQRIPSPRELQVHTQNILQRALIKKKLEEQQENYRKKQEMQRGQSPSAAAVQGAAKSVASPTPLAFTPTSVLRKMTADKDDGKENKGAAPAAGDAKAAPQGRAVTGMRPQPAQTQGQQWSQQFGAVKQPGRPIVKANSNYQGQAGPEQFFAQQQQRMFGQSQQPQQQRKPTAGQFGGGSQAPNGHPGGGPPTAYNPPILY
ncbi:hypothetical protein NQ318_015039 [Aromia moschata]|uniref:Eukaryotic translation initiation factor 4E transporter n=1 Tax=Aromia moschata TaxID=1265417 RepID=A0AAV8YW60_9CUCU|nr:hypothetical protein NQ318_015039 [Aromia moschata]